MAVKVTRLDFSLFVVKVFGVVIVVFLLHEAFGLSCFKLYDQGCVEAKGHPTLDLLVLHLHAGRMDNPKRLQERADYCFNAYIRNFSADTFGMSVAEWS